MRYLFSFPLFKELNDYAAAALPRNEPEYIEANPLHEPDYYQSAAALKDLGFAARIERYDPWTEDEAARHLLYNIFGFK